MLYLFQKRQILIFFLCIFAFCVAAARVEGRALKILVIETYFPPQMSTAALNQIINFVKSGHTVHIYPKWKSAVESAHPDIERYKLMGNVIHELKLEELRSYDVIYCMFGHRANEFIEFLGNHKLPNTKIVVCFRGSDLTKYVKRKSRNCYSKLFARADLFLPVCHYFKEKLISLGCEAEKIIVFPSTIDCSFFAYRERVIKSGEPIKLASVSRLTRKKGLEYSIKAVAQLAKKYPQIEYRIAGSGVLQSALEKLIASLKMEKHIKLIGKLSQEEVRKFLHESHIFVLPSMTDSNGDQEGIPNALKEAMAVGLPVVATYHAGIPELVLDEMTGFLVPEKSSKALVQKIEYLIQNPGKWGSMCRAARKTIEMCYESKKVNAKLTPLLSLLVRGTLKDNKNRDALVLTPIEYIF